MFLSYDEYIGFGGKLDEGDFILAVWKAEQKINNFEGIPVHERLVEFDSAPIDIKLLLTELIEREAERNKTGNLTSISQSLGNESISKSYSVENFDEKETSDAELIRNVLKQIPYKAVSLYYRGADCD